MPRSESGAARKPRVIFVTMTFDPEPGNIRGLPLARWLAGRGYEVRVLTAFPNYPVGRLYPGYRMRPWMREVMDGVPVLRVPIYPSHDTSALRRIWTYLSFALSAATLGVALVGRGDLVYLYDPPPTNGLSALILKLLWRAPVVHHIGDLWPESATDSGFLPQGRVNRLIKSVLGAYCRFLYRRADVITVLSPGFKRILMERGVPEAKLRVVYNWADEETFRPLERDQALAAELGMTGRFNFVFAGNLGYFQGLDTVIRAAAMVRDDPRIQVVVVGTGALEGELKALAAELRADNVRFVARREIWEMPRINALADVLLVHLKDFPFMAVTIPSKTQVSLASGRPVLLGARGDVADLVENAGAGVVVPPEDPAAMAAAMRRMAALPAGELERMGGRGREYYLEHLSLDVAGREMDQIFEVLARRRLAAPAARRAQRALSDS
ncbi:MAG TPA: glycosyltransferase family 4 protein [Longimicrobium sp.]